jgi:hypothetical protein
MSDMSPADEAFWNKYMELDDEDEAPDEAADQMDEAKYHEAVYDEAEYDQYHGAEDEGRDWDGYAPYLGHTKIEHADADADAEDEDEDDGAEDDEEDADEDEDDAAEDDEAADRMDEDDDRADEVANPWGPPNDSNDARANAQSADVHTDVESDTDPAVKEVVGRMNRSYAWVEKQGAVYRFEHADFVSVTVLRQQFANTGIMVDVGQAKLKKLTDAEIWLRSPERRTHENVAFVPGGGPIVDHFINYWKGWGVVGVRGDLAPWNEMLDLHFAGNPAARRWFEQWAAYPIQHPGTKLTTAAVLWSTQQGVGKSMVGETIGQLYGKHSRTVTSAELQNKYNGWMRDCQFVLGEENSGSNQRSHANRLKVLITGETLFVNEKFQPAIELKNCMNLLFTSNHPDAFHLEAADRRFFIWEIIAARQPDEFYNRFIHWRDNQGGLAALMDHLQKLDLTGFLPKGNAPTTEAKLEMIQHSKCDTERWLDDRLEDQASVIATFGKEVFSLEELTEMYRRQGYGRITNKAMSMVFGKVYKLHAKLRVSLGKGMRRNLISLINHERWEAADASEWAAEYKRPTPMSL